MLMSVLKEGQNLELALAALEASSLVAIADQQGAFLYVNSMFCQIANMQQEQLLGRSFQDLSSSEQAVEVYKEVQEQLEQGKVWRGELTCVSDAGESFWLQLTIVPISNVQGEKSHSIAFGTDITERKLNEIKLNKTIENLVEIENALDESSIVAITDQAGVITYVNDKFCEISKYSREELVGKTHRIINSGYHPKSFFKDMWKTIKNGGIWHGEVKNRAKDGTEYWMKTTIVPFFDDSRKPRQFISIRSDITDRVKAEQELAERTDQLARMRDEAVNASNVKSQFLANMSHELRTPLNAIIGYSEMLHEEAVEMGDMMFVEDLKKISTAGSHLLALINDILDISKIEAGRMELHYEESSLTELVHDVMITMRPLIENKGNTLIYEAEQYGEMTTDVLKLRQVLLNFLSNANKFTEQGQITVAIHAQQHNGRDGFSFYINDTGIGMSAEQMSKLFQPFTQVDSSLTRKYGGTGLGLSISQRFVQMLGGYIEVDSELGAGTSFTCWLPSQQELISDKQPVEASQQIRETSGKVNILLIDDERSNYDLMERYIAKTGWSIMYANNGEEGIRLAKENQPDVICLDVLMPGMDGWSVLTALKQEEVTAHIPVVIWSMATDLQRGYEFGATEYLTKPSERERLIEIISKYVVSQ